MVQGRRRPGGGSHRRRALVKPWATAALQYAGAVLVGGLHCPSPGHGMPAPAPKIVYTWWNHRPSGCCLPANATVL